MQVSKELRKLIAVKRQEKGLSQPALARLVSVPKHVIYQIERQQEKKPSTLDMRNIGKALGLRKEVDREIKQFRQGNRDSKMRAMVNRERA